MPRFGTHVVHPRPQSRASDHPNGFERRPSSASSLATRASSAAPELPPADAALVRAVDPYDDELYAWALRRHASCGSPADARPSH